MSSEALYEILSMAGLFGAAIATILAFVGCLAMKKGKYTRVRQINLWGMLAIVPSLLVQSGVALAIWRDSAIFLGSRDHKLGISILWILMHVAAIGMLAFNRWRTAGLRDSPK